ncbi:hypothetical protein BWI17_01165 [Betaproteobacteria bacterium GR16-43]|nr:hypothetical protein BWI17_01165 [Betaproteobacteria bacterium GR16-43]
MKMLSGLCLAMALCVPAAALAQTAPLYKLVDKNGKVTYAEKIPPGWEGQATRVDIDTQRNTATLPKASSAPTEGSPRPAAASSPAKEAAARKEKRIEAAKKGLEDAKANLADAIANPSEDDVQRIGNARTGGGATARAVWSDEYRARIEGLEKAVKDAEAKLAEAEAST